MKLIRCLPLLLIVTVFSCHQQPESNTPVVGFVDAFEDATIAQARTGFFDALKKNGFSKGKGTLVEQYRNAENSIPTLTQIVNYFIAEKVTLLATCTTLATVTAAQKTKTIPVFMMVSPTVARMHLIDAKAGHPPTCLVLWKT